MGSSSIETTEARDATITRDEPPIGRVRCEYRPGKGRGVVATSAFRAGVEVERSPVIIVPDTDLIDRAPDLTVFDQYLLYWSDDPGEENAMGCGLLMIYNHSRQPNIELCTGPDRETMSVVTLRDVAAGEELCYDYDIDLWFAPVESRDSGAGSH